MLFAAGEMSLQAQDLASPAAPGSAEPSLAAGKDGRVFMTWLEPADSAFALRFAALDGERWSVPRTIRVARDFFVNWADFPSVIELADGRLAAHWLQRTGKSTYAYGVRIAQSRDGGASWSSPVTPHADSSDNEHGFVALWPEGQALGAAWLDGRKFTKSPQGGHSLTNEMMVVSTAIEANGARRAERVLDARACDCCQTSAAVTARGPIVVYRDRSADEIRDIYVVRRVGTQWTTPMAVHQDGWKIAACPVNGPAVDALQHRVAVAWFTAANDSAQVKLAFSNDGGARFEAPVRVDDGKPAGRVDVALTSDGSALVIWIERTGGDTAVVRLRRVTRTGTSAGAVTIAQSSAARASGFPRMVIAGPYVVFAWTAPGRPSAVRVSRLPLNRIP